MSRPQPYRIDWTERPADFDPLNERLGSNFESIDQMFQMLFEDLAAVARSTSSTGTTSNSVSEAQVLTRVFLRG